MEIKNGIIYIITNKVSKKIYIGLTTRDVSVRFKEHLYENSIVGKSMRKNKIENFTIDIIEQNIKTIEILNEKEIFFIAKYNAKDRNVGYNLTSGGKGSTGYKPSQEAIRKMSEANKGEKHYLFGKHRSEETKRKLSIANIGKHHSPETIQKISKANSGENHPMFGKHHSPESIQNMIKSHVGLLSGDKNPMFGKHHSDEAKKKISEHNKGLIVGEKHPLFGKHLSEETKRKLSIANTGKHHSEETKKKISEKCKGRIVSEETRIKMSKASTGRITSEQTKLKISNSKKGKSTATEETRRKMSESRTGTFRNQDTKDKMSKAQLGEKNHQAILNLKIVEEIRKNENNLTHQQLASKYNVSRSCISNVINHKTWKI